MTSSDVDHDLERAREELEATMGPGWSDPSDKARSVGLTRREFMEETGLKSLGAAGVAGTAGLAGLAGCLDDEDGDDGESDDDALDVGYIPITDASPLLAAYANGHWDDHDVDVNEPTMFRGWDDLAESFFGGDLDIAHFLMPMTVWMKFDLQEDVKVVAWDHTDGSAMTVHEGVDDWEDLGGGRVAVPFWYSIHNIVLQMALDEVGLTPRIDTTDVADDEVSLVVMPPPDMPAALSERNIDGYIVAEPFNAAGELDAGGRILRFTGDIWRRHACCVVTMRESAVESQPGWTEDVLSGVVDAQRWIRRNRTEAAGLLAEEGSGLLPQPREVVERALTHYDEDEYHDSGAITHPDWDLERIDFYPYPYPSYTEELVRRMRATKVEGDAEFLDDLEPEGAADDLVAYEPVRNALEAAGGPNEFEVEEEDGYERTETIEF
ncbi:MAG: ABC transporter substrate-binding protein [Halobacteriota archaeon]